jgi:hypothetical protein
MFLFSEPQVVPQMVPQMIPQMRPVPIMRPMPVQRPPFGIGITSFEIHNYIPSKNSILMYIKFIINRFPILAMPLTLNLEVNIDGDNEDSRFGGRYRESYCCHISIHNYSQ